MNLDEWFGKVREKYAGQMQCGKGCSACCHGLFDVSLSDAVQVAAGFQSLPADVQKRITAKSIALQDVVRSIAPDLAEPALFAEDDPRIDEIVNGANSPPCPCLGDAGECLIYEHRPLPCRLEGVPMIDIQDGLFGDWCELNFQTGVPEDARKDLQQDYNTLADMQESRSAEVAKRVGSADALAVTFIPSVIAEYQTFWKRLLP